MATKDYKILAVNELRSRLVLVNPFCRSGQQWQRSPCPIMIPGFAHRKTPASTSDVVYAENRELYRM
ncbi:MAG: hypothetical protein AAGE59_10980 [Cyanobacteria bacterium P01_F01_bin.86]